MGLYPLHFRAALRLGRNLEYSALPFKRLGGFRFASDDDFDGVEKRAQFIWLRKRSSRDIHKWAERQLAAILNDIPGVRCQVRWERTRDRPVSVLEISHGDICILAIIRNWVNPIFQSEISRISKILNNAAEKVRGRYRKVWKYVLAPVVEKGQTSLDYFAEDVHVYPIEYLIPAGLHERLAKEAGVDYSFAYGGREFWPLSIEDLLRNLFGRLLRCIGHREKTLWERLESARSLAERRLVLEMWKREQRRQQVALPTTPKGPPCSRRMLHEFM